MNFHNQRKKEILAAQSNKANIKIIELQKQYGPKNFKIFTSNIDNLLEKCGCQEVCHIHGDIFTVKCLDCKKIFNIKNNLFDISMKCHFCQSANIKPNIVFFGETAPLYK